MHKWQGIKTAIEDCELSNDSSPEIMKRVRRLNQALRRLQKARPAAAAIAIAYAAAERHGAKVGNEEGSRPNVLRSFGGKRLPFDKGMSLLIMKMSWEMTVLLTSYQKPKGQA